MITLTSEPLREQVRGDVIDRDDDAYEEARHVYNAMIDRRPAVIVRAVNAGDVLAAVRFANENRLPVAIRGGGHSVPGFGTWDEAVVIDLVRMRGVRVDPKSEPLALRAGRPGATSMPPPMPSGWPPPAGSSRRPASPD